MKKTIIAVILLISVLMSLASCAAAAPDGDMAPNAADMNAATGQLKPDGDDAQYSESELTTEDVYSDPDYGKFIENEFIKTEDENVSTFSADVDTASYAYFRKLVNQGYSLKELISLAGQSVRTEEMLNYFSYDYAAPADGQLFGVNSYITSCPWNSAAVLLTLGLRADDAVASAGNNLVFLIDVSGSMRSSDKLDLLKKAFTYLTEQLTEKDTVSIVTYSGKEAVVLTGCPGNKTEKILSAVRNLEASGSTNGQAGLEKAYSLAADYFIEGGNNRIIMASDGDLNVGISSAEELKRFVETKRDQGIYLSVLGFGTGNYRDANMEALADNGNGVYYYIDGEAEAEKIFGQDLLGTLYTVAEDVKLQITFDKTFVDSYRLVGYENRLLQKEDFEDDTKDAGEVGAGHTVTVCYELILTDAAEAAISLMGEDAVAEQQQWLSLAVRHKAPGETQSQLNEYSIGNEKFGDASDDVKFMCAVIETAMLLHESEHLVDISLENIISSLDELDLSDDIYKEEFRELLKKLAK